ncbi:energy-coupling factor transporter transmembrane protein EcfT [Paeniglutamicibacter sp. ZC-3]|uniref:energy-coupling factor transporter transmembrane component T family protein n=1 Tax=Paeniglutamicibacter TaxID=1742990 RepID=UPI0021F7DF67|nr:MULTISPECIES: energy-coupling factor transporter transmembrane protein EcfT [Paeniglutamicibacter]MCV9993793.1 energy-coupling factor transporter transmembrane protein EcfT [Paeniglutamicibacter sp. ZC-3]MDO2936557.1 energy-coupling factor transporter transmembrane protein EcfT [Paeniglutamicibacter sulfureus]
MSASHQMLLGHYLPGASPVHRAPLLAKYLVVLAVGAAVLLWRIPAVGLGTLLLGVGLFALAGPRVLRAWAAPLRQLWWIFAILGIYQSILNTPLFALTLVSGMLAVIQCGRLVLLTTTQAALLDGLERAAAPVRLIGGNPATIALAVALMLRSIPAIASSVQDLADAAKARGIGRNPATLAAPVVINTVAYAQRTADALAARGIMERN